MKILFFGATGWIGSQLIKLLSGNEIIIAKSRLDNSDDLIKELNENNNVTHIVLAAGLTGRPNIDWCEDHKQEMISVNVIGPSIIGKFSYKNKIHMTYFGTGCIYEYDDEHKINGKGFNELDKPNYDKSCYSHTKLMTENILKEFNTLILRVRMPLSADLNPRNIITKLIKYEKIINIPNSMTILDDFLPLVPNMMEKELVGIYNFTNPGTISHNEILDLYKKYIDSNFKYINFSLEDQAKILKTGRSNNYLDSSKIISIYPNIPNIKISIIKLFEKMANSINK